MSDHHLAPEFLTPAWLSEVLEPLAKATRVLVLLRFEANEWCLQPLAGTQKNKWITPAKAIEAAVKLKAPSVDVLAERATRLLRR